MVSKSVLTPLIRLGFVHFMNFIGRCIGLNWFSGSSVLHLNTFLLGILRQSLKSVGLAMVSIDCKLNSYEHKGWFRTKRPKRTVRPITKNDCDCGLACLF